MTRMLYIFTIKIKHRKCQKSKLLTANVGKFESHVNSGTEDMRHAYSWKTRRLLSTRPRQRPPRRGAVLEKRLCSPFIASRFASRGSRRSRFDSLIASVRPTSPSGSCVWQIASTIYSFTRFSKKIIIPTSQTRRILDPESSRPPRHSDTYRSNVLSRLRFFFKRITDTI